MTRILALIFVFTLGSASSAGAQELIRHEATCKGAPPSVRQTIIVLDDAAISREPLGHPSHLAWTRPVLDAVDLLNTGASGRLAPQERVSILLARRSTGDLAQVFVGCSPNLDAAEIEKMRSERSSISAFIFGSLEKDLEARRKGFDGSVRDSFAQMRRAVGESPVSATNDLKGLVPALRLLSQAIDLSLGAPRIVLISPLTMNPGAFADMKAARIAGFADGADAGVDFHRAEIAIIGATGSSDPKAKAYTESFFLRSKALVIGWRTDGLPPLTGIPTKIYFFGGSVDYGDISAPVQIRIAADSSGNLVNSWIEVTAGRSLASPITGKAICRTRDACEIKGDGRLLGQAWNPDPKERPAFDPQFAWTGMRFFEMKIEGNAARAKISDPLVSGVNLPLANGGTKLIDAFMIDVRSTEGQQF